eukprot:COSAG01_NODE_24_length_37608_cov_19.303154_19_plen_57_part_00
MCRIMGPVTSLTAGAGDHFFAGTASSVRGAPPPSHRTACCPIATEWPLLCPRHASE